jgi:predicted RNase H-like nuclease (RuvC/YqgF family)
MQTFSRNNQSEIAKAEATLKSLEANLQNIRSMLNERKAERYDLEARPQAMEATGDINRLMTLKRRTMALDKEIAQLNLSEMEAKKRVDSVRQYLNTLYAKLDGLRSEAAKISEKLAVEKLPEDVAAKLHTLLRRVEIQIEAISGA